MPEGPEIKYIAEVCKTYLINYKLVKSVGLPQKSKLIDVKSRGKLLVLVFKDYFLHIHFGLTGWIVFDRDESKYPKYELTFKKKDKELKIYIDDLRKFSKIKFLNRKQHKKTLEKLGIDIFSDNFTREYFASVITNSKKKIVSLLLDQNKFCGIGNYIKNESLYIAGIDPHSKASDIDNDKITELYKAIKFCAFSNFMELIKENNLEIDKTELDKIQKEKLEVPYKYRVYGQKVDPVGNRVIRENISGRQTYYVKEIQ